MISFFQAFYLQKENFKIFSIKKGFLCCENNIYKIREGKEGDLGGGMVRIINNIYSFSFYLIITSTSTRLIKYSSTSIY